MTFPHGEKNQRDQVARRLPHPKVQRKQERRWRFHQEPPDPVGNQRPPAPADMATIGGVDKEKGDENHRCQKKAELDEPLAEKVLEGVEVEFHV